MAIASSFKQVNSGPLYELGTVKYPLIIFRNYSEKKRFVDIVMSGDTLVEKNAVHMVIPPKTTIIIVDKNLMPFGSGFAFRHNLI